MNEEIQQQQNNVRQRSAVGNGWWIYLAALLVLAALFGYIIYSSTQKLIEQAETNSIETRKLFQELDKSSHFVVSTDTLGRQIIDSVKVASPEAAKALREVVIERSTEKMTQYSEQIAVTAQQTTNLILIWAGVLTLLSIIFTFLGFLEVRSRMDKLDEGLRAVDDTLIRITQKAEEIDKVKIEVREDAKISGYNLELQGILSRYPKKEDRIKDLEALATKLEGEICKTCEDKRKVLLRDCYFHLGYSSHDKDSDKAIEFYTKAIEIRETSTAYYNRGILYKRKGKLDKALEDYNKAIELKKDYENAYYNRGLTYEALGNKAESKDEKVEYYKLAIKDFERVLQINPKEEGSQPNINRIKKKIEDLDNPPLSEAVEEE